MSRTCRIPIFHWAWLVGGSIVLVRSMTAHQSGSANIDIECGHCVVCESATYQIYRLTWRTCSHLSAQAHFQFQKCHFCDNWASSKPCVKVGFNRALSHLSAQAHFQFQKCHFCNSWASPKQCVKVGFNRALKLVRGSQSQTLIGGGSYCFGLQWGLRCLVRIELNMAENCKGMWPDMAENGDDRRSWTILKRVLNNCVTISFVTISFVTIRLVTNNF